MYQAPDFVKVSTKMNDVFATYHPACESRGAGTAQHNGEESCHSWVTEQWYTDMHIQNCVDDWKGN